MDGGFVFLVIVLVVLGCGTGIAVRALELIFGKERRTAADTQRLEAALTGLRQQIAEVKSWAGDLVLSFESTLEQHEARLHSLERRVLSDGTPHADLTSGDGAANRELAPQPLEVQRRA